jgi:hypothetical protein
LAALVAYYFGLRTYFKQREHEQIMKRYLDEGIDLVLAGINRAFRVFIDNHHKALNALKQVEEKQEVNAPVAFEVYDRHILEVTPYLKANRLIGDDIFGNVIGAFLGFVEGNRVLLENEFQQLRNIITEEGTQTTLTLDSAIKEVRQRIDDAYKKYVKYFTLVGELQEITMALEKQKNLSWADLDNFKNRNDIKEIVKRLRECFKEEVGIGQA